MANFGHNLGGAGMRPPHFFKTVRKKFAQTKPPTLVLLCAFVGGYTDSFISRERRHALSHFQEPQKNFLVGKMLA